jgi:hypothetical protein
MYDFLKDHAYRNVWCTPEQDTQVILEMAKITPIGGVKNIHKVMWRNIALPDQTSTWHIYQIGQVHPLILGLFPKTSVWVSFAETSNRQKMICDVYNSEGVQLPRVETFYMYNNDRNLIVAVKKNNRIPFNFNNDEIFLRVYSNEFFNTQRAHNTDDFIHVEGGRFTSTQDILDLQTEYNNYIPLEGQVYAFVNGLKVDSIDLITCQIGDVAEFVYDSSIYKVVDFVVEDLLTFESILDLKRKYLLHYSGADNGTIDYQDDIDVFILRDTGSSRHKGLFYHKNNVDSFRSLTHRDYSVTVPYVISYKQKIQSLVPENDVVTNEQLYVRLHIRKSGYQRNLVFENNRIHELYKLSDENIVKAMLGIDSTVKVWRAEELENSGYTRVMRSYGRDITNQMVEDAYGYNAISFISGNTPSEIYNFSANNVVDVPYVLQKGCTAYEYNEDGDLLEWHYHPTGIRYTCQNPNTRRVELIAGRGEQLLNEVYGFTSTPYSRELDFRIYQCRRVSGLPDNNFIDVTNDSTKYSVDNGRIVWLEQNPVFYPMVRFNSSFLAYDTEVSMDSGELKITLAHLQRRGSQVSNWIMQVPMGELDVFLNGKSLIRNLDYVYKFPEIYIINKTHLIDPLNQTQDVHIRFTGFCDPNKNLRERTDAGFIYHGVLSDNFKYDIRDDKVLRITVDGQLKTRDDLVFSEFHSGVSILDPLNGKPYQIKDIVVPLRGIASSDTYTLREKSEEIDDTVSDYLSLKIPQPPRPAFSAIPNRYPVFSPFLSKILHDLVEGRLIIQDKIHTKQEVLTICNSYEYLLKFDPTQEEQRVNDSYVIIHPHALDVVMGVPLNTYRFIDQANRFYTNNKVSLSPFLITT